MRWNFFILVTLLLSGCIDKVDNNDLPNLIKDFDVRNRVIIDELCDSLKAKIGIDTNYVMEYRPRSREVYFSYKDSYGNGTGYFKSRFRINSLEEEFFMNAKVGEIYFDRTNNYFSMKIFRFKKANEAVKLFVVYDNSTVFTKSIFDDLIYYNGSHYYTLTKAW